MEIQLLQSLKDLIEDWNSRKVERTYTDEDFYRERERIQTIEDLAEELQRIVDTFSYKLN